MELWLDTIELETIRETEAMGFLTGVTTNPSILSQSDVAPEKKLKQLLDYQSGYVAAQVVAQNAHNMIKEAEALARLSDRIIVKIPVTAAGLTTISTLRRNEICTMATAIFEPSQLLLAAVAGAHYAAPYMSHIQGAPEILSDMMKIIFQQSFHTKIIAAAIKSADEVVAYAKLGVPAITLPPSVYKSFITNNSRTEASLRDFNKAWLAGSHTGESKIFSAKN